MTTNTNKIMLVAIAAVVIITASLVVSMQTSEKQAFAQQQVPLYREKIITVTGTATTTASPDLLMIRFGVETEAKTAKEAIDANSAAMTEVVDAVQKLGITKEELSTASLTIYPVYSDVEDPILKTHKSVLTGYRASNILAVKTQKLDLAGGIIDAATGAGANRVDSVTFSLSPSKQLAVQDELLDKAVLNAKSKAEKALSPLGQKIIGVKLVSLSEFGYPPPPYPYASGELAPMAFKSTPVFSADQDVTTTANVMFLIGDQ